MEIIWWLGLNVRYWYYVEEMRDREFDVIVAHADTISLNFYYKNGFI